MYACICVVAKSITNVDCCWLICWLMLTDADWHAYWYADWFDLQSVTFTFYNFLNKSLSLSLSSGGRPAASLLIFNVFLHFHFYLNITFTFYFQFSKMSCYHISDKTYHYHFPQEEGLPPPCWSSTPRGTQRMSVQEETILDMSSFAILSWESHHRHFFCHPYPYPKMYWYELFCNSIVRIASLSSL